MTLLEKLMPRSDDFFSDFEAQVGAVVEGTKLLKDLLDDFTDVQRKTDAIKAVEHRADDITHRAFARLHTQFITPFDRGEIHRLLSRIDDVLDLADAASERTFKKDSRQLLEACREINVLENQADTLTRQTMAKLFRRGNDPLTVVKWKEIIDLIESATDRAEDVANVIEGVVLEHA